MCVLSWPAVISVGDFGYMLTEKNVNDLFV